MQNLPRKVENDKFGVKEIYIHPNSSNFIYVVGFAGNFWISQDSGRNFTFVDCEFEINSLRLNSINPMQILAITYSRWYAIFFSYFEHELFTDQKFH